jgi:hypothetical protein
LSVRFTARFGAPAVAGITLGHGIDVWLATVAFAGALLAGVILLHAFPGIPGLWRRLARRG